ncbi:MAG: hypothetical protein H8F28_12195 [Fibrella sp.]|nr:hypothetical protein [Armatimonadota bacterium]
MMSPVPVRSPISRFTPQGGSAIHIRPFSTDDLLFFAEFREKLKLPDESVQALPPLTMMPPIPRVHPRFGDQLTLVAYRDVSEYHRSILAAAQLYPHVQVDRLHHAEAVILIEPGSRDSGLESEMMRLLLELARDVGTRTMEVIAHPVNGESATPHRRHIRVADDFDEPAFSPDTATGSVA